MEQNKQPESPRWIRPVKWQQLTGMSERSTYRALELGQIKAVQHGKQWFIPVSEIDEFFERAAKVAA